MIGELNKICNIIEFADLYSYNTFKLHSKCRVLVNVNDINELKSVFKVLKKYDSKWFVIGNGSNIILPDYYDGVVIKLVGFNHYDIKDNILYVESDCMINKVSSEISSLGYAGLDFATGIPGCIGGSIVGNAGAYGSCISDVLISALVYDGNDTFEMSNEDFNFEYRNSKLKGKRDIIILSAKFQLKKVDVLELKDIILDRTNKRISSQDLSHPSNGSVFRNPDGFAAGKLIDDAGLKGTCVNGAAVSCKHANFIINDGNATANDIIELIDIIRKKVKDVYDIDLYLEQEIIK